jgi:penicillin-binding protein 2
MSRQPDSETIAPARVGVFGVIIVSLLCALMVRLWYIQGVSPETFAVAAEANAQRTIFTEPPRGRIFDRNGVLLVDNRILQVLTVDRSAARKDPEMVARLATVLGVSVDEINSSVEDVRQSPLRPAVIAEDVPLDRLTYIREHAELFPTVDYTQATERVYVQGVLAPHILGYVGQINGDELDQKKDLGYRAGDVIGRSGVERAYEEVLRGEPGKTILEVDKRNRIIRVVAEEPPTAGDDLFLTIDANLQRAAEAALETGVNAARSIYDADQQKNFLATAGSAVAMDPRNGEVLALASYPTYDPAVFVGGISNEDFQALQSNGAPMNNRATQGLYAPGSTFKPITGIAAINDGLIAPSSVVIDRGSYTVQGKCEGRCTFSNAGGTEHGTVNLASALAVSSNVYFYKLGDEFYQRRSALGDGIQDTGKEFGLAEKSGIETAEYEGRVSDEATRRALHESNPSAFPDSRWFVGDNIFTAVGQSETVATPLQITNMYATIANGGSLYTPHYGLRAVSPTGQEVFKYQPNIRRTVTMGPTTRQAILEGLSGAVNSGGGTAFAAFSGSGLINAGWTVAGKTGTAQGFSKQDTALFSGFAPINDPKLAVTVVIEEGGYGGAVAAPTARQIFQAAAGLEPTPIRTAAVLD